MAKTNHKIELEGMNGMHRIELTKDYFYIETLNNLETSSSFYQMFSLDTVSISIFKTDPPQFVIEDSEKTRRICTVILNLEDLVNWQKLVDKFPLLKKTLRTATVKASV